MTARRRAHLTLVFALMTPLVVRAALGPRYGGTLTIGVLDLPSSIDPSHPQGAGARLMLELVHETLVRIGADGSLRPGLVDQWNSSSSGKEWTLELPHSTRFHDGAPLTAADVVRSLRRFLRSSSDAARVFASSLDGGDVFRSRKTDDLPGLIVVNESQIVLRFTDLDARPLAPLAASTAAITSAKGAGCGPFAPLQPLRRQGITLLSFRDHVRGRPFLDRIRVELQHDAAALRSAFDNGEVALALDIAGRSSLAGTLILKLDTSRRPFQRRSFRAAVSSALDREVLASRYLPGSKPAIGLLVPRLLMLHSDQSPSRTHASKLSNDAIVMAVSETVPPLASQRVVAHLSALGLHVRVEVVAASATRWPSAHARLMVYRPEVGDPYLALNELSSLIGPQENVMALLREARGEINTERRAAYLRAAHDELLRDNTLIPLAVVPVAYAASPKLEGIQMDRAGRLSLEDAWIAP